MLQIILTLAVFVALLVFLYYLQKKHVKYARRVFTGLGIGIVFGAIIQLLFGSEGTITETIIDWMDIVGLGYVNFLQMLVIPLILVSLIRAFTQIEDEADQGTLGRIGGSVLSVLIITVCIAAFIGISSVLLFGLDGAEITQGAAETARIAQIQEQQTQVADLSLPQQIISFIPSNVFRDLSGARSTSTIAVVIFSAIVGVAYLGVARKRPEEGATFKRIIDSLHAIVTRIVTLVLRMAPYGILALMAKMVATSSFDALLNLGTFIIASYFAIITMFIIHGIILAIYKVNPIQYYKKAWNVLSFAFTSRSSAAALPLNISTQEYAMGVDGTTANFSASFGLSIGQNGCAGLYPAMLVAIIAPTVGIDLSNPVTWLYIIGVVAISSFGVAGVGGGATFASLIVFGTLGLPVEIIGLMVSIEPIIDMGRTALNVNDSIVAGVVTSQRMNNLDNSVMNDNTKHITPELEA